jgi:enolase
VQGTKWCIYREHEAVELRDGGKYYMGKGVLKAVKCADICY